MAHGEEGLEKMTSGFPDKTVTPAPLSDYARGILEGVARAPVPTLEINAGVMDRFIRGRLVDIVPLKSTYKSHNGREIPHAKITDAGRAELGIAAPAPAKRKRKP